MHLKYRLKTVVFIVCFTVVFSSIFTASGFSFNFHKTDEKNDGVVLPIVMYHEVKRSNLHRLAISPYEFESDLKYLIKEGYTAVVMSDLINYVYNDMPLPPKPIVITFDDGYLNNYAYAYPLLKKYNMSAVMSIIGKDTDDFTDTKCDNLDYSHLNWDQVIELLNSGCFEIQNHTYNLHSQTSKRIGCKRNPGESLTHYAEVLRNDLVILQKEMEEKTGVLPNTFTYPYGNVSEESKPIIKEIGFTASLSCKYGINIITKDPDKLYCLKRISRYHDVTLKKTLDEAYKTLH
jgi:peptidoglycan/xylan/chitin deacetylase (PgdA/CDA1 family)